MNIHYSKYVYISAVLVCEPDLLFVLAVGIIVNGTFRPSFTRERMVYACRRPRDSCVMV